MRISLKELVQTDKSLCVLLEEKGIDLQKPLWRCEHEGGLRTFYRQIHMIDECDGKTTFFVLDPNNLPEMTQEERAGLDILTENDRGIQCVPPQAAPFCMS